MGAIGKGKANVTAQTSAERQAYVVARAQRLGWSVSKFAGCVFDAWFAAGCPNVTEIEAGLPIMPFGMKTESSDQAKHREKHGRRA